MNQKKDADKWLLVYNIPEIAYVAFSNVLAETARAVRAEWYL